MKRGYVHAIPHSPEMLRALATPIVHASGSFDWKLAEARKRLAPFLAKPRTDPDRQQIERAAIAGAEAYDSDSQLNPYPADSAEAASWLLGWWTRSRENS